MDDVLAVLAASISFKATIFGGGRSAFVAMLAAATHPEHFDGLILFGSTSTWIRSDELPWQETEEDVKRTIDQIRRASSAREWASSWVRGFAPSLPEASIHAIGSYDALTAGRGGNIAEVEMFNRVDLRTLLPSIRVPTLVLHRTADPSEPIESGRLVAASIPNARLVELPGADALPWIGAADAVIDQIELFLTGERRSPEPDRVLATVRFTDVVDSTSHAASMDDRAWREVLRLHDGIIRDELRRARGHEVKTMGDGFLATFDGPARGIRCALEIVRATRELGIEIRAGMHTGEIEIDGDDVAGIAVTIGARVGALAGAPAVLVSQTVKDLVAGSGTRFEDPGEHELKGVPDRWRLYRVVGG